MEKNEKENMKMEDEKPVVDANDEETEKINYRGIKVMPFIIGNETFEKLGAIGTLSNLQVYLTTVFNMSRLSATTLLNVFNGTTNIATLVGAYLCDTYFGRYKTLGFASIASLLGLLVITLTAVFKNLHPPHCSPGEKCIGPDAGQMAFLIFGFALMIIGAGGIRPCNLAFGVDQFNPKTESGKRGIDSFFNWYYFTITFAQIISLTLVVYVQSNISWSIGLAIPAVCMFLSCFLYFVGTKMYVKVKPEGSPMTSLVQVMVVAVKKRKLKLPEEPSISLFNYVPPKSVNSRLPHTEQFSFLDKAAIITPEDNIKPDGSAVNPWTLCSIQQVEAAKCVMRVLPVSLTAIFYHIGVQQQYIVFQALQSNRHLGNTNFQIPAASYVVFPMIGLTLWVPLYDRIIVPFLRKITKKEQGITILQRMGIGIFITILESLVGAILALGGLAEAFNAIGQIEFYYKQFPENMRSIGGAFFFCGNAVSSYVYSFLISVVHRMTEGAPTGNWLPEDLNKGRLDYFYYLVAVLCVLNFGYFLACASWYRYKGSEDGSVSMEMETRKPEQYSV
ncbi:H+/oligopeptide symporter [Handroanthus impetiginosus]|uniref:H+/oligopeptide symporter n=1 Tax=Handroanthus impetiginosus TaxID=429701 RepID=A0A2G9GDN2_9LAMI|nr:H+/oligopeptide symporter [Handroanthus impetiginosus]